MSVSAARFGSVTFSQAGRPAGSLVLVISSLSQFLESDPVRLALRIRYQLDLPFLNPMIRRSTLKSDSSRTLPSNAAPFINRFFSRAQESKGSGAPISDCGLLVEIFGFEGKTVPDRFGWRRR